MVLRCPIDHLGLSSQPVGEGFRKLAQWVRPVDRFRVSGRLKSGVFRIRDLGLFMVDWLIMSGQPNGKSFQSYFLERCLINRLGLSGRPVVAEPRLKAVLQGHVQMMS